MRRIEFYENNKLQETWSKNKCSWTLRCCISGLVKNFPTLPYFIQCYIDDGVTRQVKEGSILKIYKGEQNGN